MGAPGWWGWTKQWERVVRVVEGVVRLRVGGRERAWRGVERAGRTRDRQRKMVVRAMASCGASMLSVETGFGGTQGVLMAGIAPVWSVSPMRS